ncbi:MAG: hypothetical protein WCR85_03665 [Sphaerochaeta sp.]|jgi:hypothetical protein|nr:hypothetical protein [Sphaerochaeta sp.]MDY0244521.1 hypothetical protein [Sphaerochaeta sp.]
MKPRKKRRKPGKANPWVLMGILAVLLLLLAFPYILHRIQPIKSLVVSVYDKTVPQKPALQHEGLA